MLIDLENPKFWIFYTTRVFYNPWNIPQAIVFLHMKFQKFEVFEILSDETFYEL